jgi:hypothetical protein
MMMKTSRAVAAAAALAALWPARAWAHHEALFGPQSSLAVESDGFVSAQMHVKALGYGASYDRESVYILSAGISPFREVPWSVTLVQPFTYEAAHTPTATSVGPLAMCDCFARENDSYRLDFTSLNRTLGNDNNFALVSAAFELPTGEKEAEPFHGPLNYIIAGMAGFGWRWLTAVALGYYRVNSRDGTGTKKGNNLLAGLGFAYTPVDEQGRLFSLQLGLAGEVHERDVLGGAPVDASGGAEIFASPTVVWGAAAGVRFFTYLSLPLAQDYRSPAQEDRWRAGAGIIYSFERSPAKK